MDNKSKEGGNSLAKSELLGDKYPHSLIVMEAVQELFRMKGCGMMAKNYLDSMILRLLVRGNGVLMFCSRMGLTFGTEITFL